MEPWARYAGAVTFWSGLSETTNRHVHVYDSKRNLIGRLDVDRLVGVEGWVPDRKLIRPHR
jgi:hypothetical protein